MRFNELLFLTFLSLFLISYCLEVDVVLQVVWFYKLVLCVCENHPISSYMTVEGAHCIITTIVELA